MPIINSKIFNNLLSALNFDVLPKISMVYHLGDIVTFRAFKQNNCIPKDRGVGCLTLEDDSIHAYGLFQGENLTNKAIEDNQTTWLLGDVFELFFSFYGQNDYYEFHSTPEGRRLQLHIPDYRTFRNIPHEEKICDLGLKVRNQIDDFNHLWFSELIIPLNGQAIEGAHFAFARYSYTTKVPQVSSYPEFPETIHAPFLWPEIKIN